MTTDRSQRTNIAEFISPETDYVSLRSTSNFESQIEYLNSTVKPNNQGGKPVLVGEHYKRDKKPYNESNPATYHFIVIVGKGYDRSARKYYYRFYDVGEPDDSKAMNENDKLFIEEDQRMLRHEAIPSITLKHIPTILPASPVTSTMDLTNPDQKAVTRRQ